MKLKEKASLVMSRLASSSTNPPVFNNQEDGTDELAIFGGQTRVLVATATPSPPLTSYNRGTNETGFSDMHPSHMRYTSEPPSAFSTEFPACSQAAHTVHQPAPKRPIRSERQNFAAYPQPPLDPQYAQPPLTRFPDGSSSSTFDPLAQVYHDVATPSMESPETWDPDMDMRDDNRVDVQWTSFMWESGMIM